MHDGVDAFRDLHRVGHLGHVGVDKFFAFGCGQFSFIRNTQLVLAGKLSPQVRADVARGARDQYRLHGFLLQCCALTAPFGALPCTIAAACAAVSIDWCSIAGVVSPAACGVAMTSARAARRGVGIWSGARPTSMAQPAMRFSSSAFANAASSTRLPRATLMRK